MSIKQSHTTSVEISKAKEVQNQSQRMSRSTVHQCGYNFIIDRNRFLLEEIQEKESKIETLDRKC